MFVQLTKEELNREISKKAWYQTNNIIWMVLFVYPLFSIVDFIFANTLWLQFFIVRIITDLVILALYSLFNRRNYNFRTLLHISLFLISATSALLCNVVDLQVLNVYYLMYGAVFLFFNLMVFWEPVNSVIQAVCALVLLGIFFNLFSQYNLDLVLANGGTVFVIIALVSCFVPGARFKIIERDVRAQLLINKSNEQLKGQNRDIAEKNNIIDAQYEELRKLDNQKNNFINIAGHDLKNLTGSIIMSNNMIKEESYRLSSDQVEFTGYIGEAASKMQYLLNKLMDVKEIESPEIRFKLEVFDANAEVQLIIKGLHETAQMNNIHFVVFFVF